MVIHVRLYVSSGMLSGEEIDRKIAVVKGGVDLALQKAKLWAKYAKEITVYVERRASLGKNI